MEKCKTTLESIRQALEDLAGNADLGDTVDDGLSGWEYALAQARCDLSELADLEGADQAAVRALREEMEEILEEAEAEVSSVRPLAADAIEGAKEAFAHLIARLEDADFSPQEGGD
jgi:hypothetical protein